METLAERIEWLQNYREELLKAELKGSIKDLITLNQQLDEINVQLTPDVLLEWNNSRRKAVIEEILDDLDNEA